MKYISKRAKSGYCAAHRTVIRISKQSKFHYITVFHTLWLHEIYATVFPFPLNLLLAIVANKFRIKFSKFNINRQRDLLPSKFANEKQDHIFLLSVSTFGRIFFSPTNHITKICFSLRFLETNSPRGKPA